MARRTDPRLAALSAKVELVKRTRKPKARKEDTALETLSIDTLRELRDALQAIQGCNSLDLSPDMRRELPAVTADALLAIVSPAAQDEINRALDPKVKRTKSR